MALSADTRPHFTTIAEFISTSGQEIIHLFLEVLLICDEMGLIGKEMFAVDGCKLPSNASKEWSGTKGDLEKKKKKMEKGIRQIVKRHREVDVSEGDRGVVEQEEQYVETLRKKVKKIKAWLPKVFGSGFGYSDYFGEMVQCQVSKCSLPVPSTDGCRRRR